MMLRQIAAAVCQLWIGATVAVSLPTETFAQRACPNISLTFVPPSPVTDQITLDIRAAVWNHDHEEATFDVSLFLDGEAPDNLLHHEQARVEPGSAAGISCRWPTTGRSGQHKIVVIATAGHDTRRFERPLEIIASDVRSTGRIDGAWVDIYHFSEAEGKYFNAELGRMSESDWRALVRAMRDIHMNVLVNTMLFQNYIHYGEHRIEQQGYQGKAFYPSQRFTDRMPTACDDALEAILSEADKYGMHVFPGIGPYAFFDFTPGSLSWHQQVAAEVWERYGHHPSFYGWYVSDEIAGDLGNDATRWRDIVNFFREFRAYCRKLAPDKPVMLATNSHFVPRAVDTYRQLLPHLDILCPFGFHRVPAGDITGEESARLLQQLCDEAGCHLWMDLETFVFHADMALYPRQIAGLVSDLRRFPNFEKTLCYQYPGLMNAPWASRQPGGAPTVTLYQDYSRYLEQGKLSRDVYHAALDHPVKLAHPYSLVYSGSGDRALVDGMRASTDYRHPGWQGYYRDDLVATIDLGQSMAVVGLQSSYLQETAPGIFLPKLVEYSVSNDGQEFRTVSRVTHEMPLEQPGPSVYPFSVTLQDVHARYVRVRAENVRTIPAGHTAAGGRAWLFADEIVVNPQ